MFCACVDVLVHVPVSSSGDELAEMVSRLTE
jgi:hypothetical protein